VGGFAMGMISFLVMLLALVVVGAPVYLLVSATGSTALIAVGIAVIVIVLATIGLFFSALNGIFQAALYKYATEGTAGAFFDDSMMSGAFRPKTKRRRGTPFGF
jgi:hypothetical protein